ncbi:hypothetical protein GETHPA_21240 [Geothrix rubra]|uniref:TMEM205-like domain-containing protein n=1 Tax=Geothrix rubra TaxID=2927977 RepID=A0ABQ5Q7Z3_9BACT|nr:DUF4149 domain-containing protein [Geothrix rubra]GLH70591.1 hypothetical protein GETHPA_21240 [Geothrix rubra]
MNERTLRRIDLLSAALLMLWAGAALGFGALMAPVLFRELPSRDVAGHLAGLVVGRLDWAAWAAFGLAGLSWGARWVAEVKEELIGPLRLWSAAWLVALLMCLASSAVVTPKVRAIRARIGAPIETLAKDSPDRVAYDRAHAISRQLFFLRILLALGLAGTVGLLPRRQEESGPEA